MIDLSFILIPCKSSTTSSALYTSLRPGLSARHHHSHYLTNFGRMVTELSEMFSDNSVIKIIFQIFHIAFE